jgi:hypothetical protein
MGVQSESASSFAAHFVFAGEQNAGRACFAFE